MKRLYALLLVLTISTAHAQEATDTVTINRFLYNTKILKDKLAPNKMTEGVAALDIYNTQSRFMDLNAVKRTDLEVKLQQDKTLSTRDKMMQLMVFKVGFTWSIFSTATDNTMYNEVARYRYAYTEAKNSVQWTIDQEVTSWEGYKVQQANAFIDGRMWNVLFTTDIPVLSGPYKFNNLPGFVVKAWDDEMQYIFEFASTQKVSSTWDNQTYQSKYTTVSKEQAKKALRTHYNKSPYDFLLDINPKNAEHRDQYPADMMKKLILTANPIERDF
ncbi:GLPGLI family protein [Myroides sp.]|uniref:GLPGLI family protein n=1 Tax=Myroides sp. TaxID=1874736 RepID=UPI003F411192